jgi:hypothetical protein
MTCVHRYRLALPNGPVVTGLCRKCGERRTWPATPDEKAPGSGWMRTAKARLKVKEKMP